ncbi:MAG: hypothetical protein HYX34_03765 [Actinobacteria bacterium]|nr:hypothetical protein [Actinomycetota bacterium]
MAKRRTVVAGLVVAVIALAAAGAAVYKLALAPTSKSIVDIGPSGSFCSRWRSQSFGTRVRLTEETKPPTLRAQLLGAQAGATRQEAKEGPAAVRSSLLALADQLGRGDFPAARLTARAVDGEAARACR